MLVTGVYIPWCFFILKLADISEASTVDVGFRMFWAPKFQPLQTVTVVMIPMLRIWGRWINGDVWRWASLQLMAPCSAWVLKKDHPLLSWRVFWKGTFRWVMWTCCYHHICFWLSFCRDWNLARVQNIIFTKNNCSKVRRAHSFFSDHPGFPWNDLTASWSRWIFQQFRWNFLKWAKTAYFQGL